MHYNKVRNQPRFQCQFGGMQTTPRDCNAAATLPPCQSQKCQFLKYHSWECLSARDNALMALSTPRYQEWPIQTCPGVWFLAFRLHSLSSHLLISFCLFPHVNLWSQILKWCIIWREEAWLSVQNSGDLLKTIVSVKAIKAKQLFRVLTWQEEPWSAKPIDISWEEPVTLEAPREVYKEPHRGLCCGSDWAGSTEHFQGVCCSRVGCGPVTNSRKACQRDSEVGHFCSKGGMEAPFCQN